MNDKYIGQILVAILSFVAISCGRENGRIVDPRFVTSPYYLEITDPTIVLDPKTNAGIVYGGDSLNLNSGIRGYQVKVSDYLLHCFELRSQDQQSGKVILKTANVDFIFRVHFNCITVAPKNINPEEYKCLYEAELQLVPDNSQHSELTFIDQLPDTLQINGIRLRQKPFFIKEIDKDRGLLYYTDYKEWEDIRHWDDDDMLEGTVIELNDKRLFSKKHDGIIDNGHLVYKSILSRNYTLQLVRDSDPNQNVCLYCGKLL